MSTPRNPHFDDNRVVWSDEFSGLYEPIPYDVQFDDQWRLFLERTVGFCDHTGVEISDDFIDDRIYELTGVSSYLASRKGETRPDKNRDIGGRLFLEPKFPIDFFAGKHCLDVGCGAGRWTKTLMALGAKVKSTDVSQHGLLSTRRINDDVDELNLFDILEKKPNLQSAFDFTLCWGVLMCTHDPYLAFRNVASTVRPGGHFYTMVYAPTYHSSEFVLNARRRFHQEARSNEEKLAFAYKLSDVPENAINLLDMLNTFYNWTIPEEVVTDWYRKAGFEDIVVLNKHEPHNCGWHVLGKKK
ncbi:class I SAM-dependent methyltransferase [Azospirillum canadense]|uniref:class I SAM-dependent methyltransferase n=1 Tax=Azospirillum canadense TaxID=403962 RepID=UPI0022280191|nr:class I SAM-dependent methyltransferase [Azospirillum canadense]MCW2240996.1 SAM-dependent methyltransferase [Azospirillum canadense]